MMASLKKYREVHAQGIYRQPEKRSVMWLRNPWDRLCSNLVIWKPQDYEEWITNVVFFEHNAHWLPQTEIHSWNGVPIWNELYLFDDLATTWPIVFPSIPLEHKRSSPNRIKKLELIDKLKPSTVDNIEAFYKEDLELYDNYSRLSFP